MLDTNTSPAPAIGRHACADVTGDAADIVVDPFALPGMQAGADLNAQRLFRLNVASELGLL